MEVLLEDIKLMISSIEEYLDNQDGNKVEYVLKSYRSFVKRAKEFNITYIDIEEYIPDVPKDVYEIILTELKMLVNKIEYKSKNNVINGNINTERDLIDFIKRNKGIESEFGKIEIDIKNKIGQGGNGSVYIGKINDIDVAIKFLIGYNSKKYKRFRAEYFNTNLVRDNMINIVNNIHYGEMRVDNSIFPYIIMKKYSQSLKQYRKNLEIVEWDDIKKIFEFFINTLKKVHDENIIHRDIKPENILLDENYNYVLADFGIAHFNELEFPVKNETGKNERLANFEFSAPEQINSKIKCTPATDIYSMAQVIYWFIFGQVHKGTGIRNIEEIFDEREAEVLNRIIYKCLQNSWQDRYQSIQEIVEEYDELFGELSCEKEYDPFEDMFKFHDILCSVNPDFYNNVSYIEDEKDIKKFFEKLNECKFQREIWFNTGIANNSMKKIKYISNGRFLLDHREISVKRIWGSVLDSVYDDICILELEEVLPYIIEGVSYFGVAVINDDIVIPVDKVQSGYVKIDGKIYRNNELRIEERYILNDYKYMVLGTPKQCSIIPKNDEFINGLQAKEQLNSEMIFQLRKNMAKNIHDDVLSRL